MTIGWLFELALWLYLFYEECLIVATNLSDTSNASVSTDIRWSEVLYWEYFHTYFSSSHIECNSLLLLKTVYLLFMKLDGMFSNEVRSAISKLCRKIIRGLSQISEIAYIILPSNLFLFCERSIEILGKSCDIQLVTRYFIQ